MTVETPTATGKALSVVITCSYNAFDEWASFVTWYSVQKMLPDAQVKICCSPQGTIKRQFFTWPTRFRVSFTLAKEHKPLPAPGLRLTPFVVMVRELGESDLRQIGGSILEVPPHLCCMAAEDDFTPFVSIRDGCAKFVTSEWIDRLEYPFPWADTFMTHTATANEVQILKLWKQLNSVFTAVGRG